MKASPLLTVLFLACVAAVSAAETDAVGTPTNPKNMNQSSTSLGYAILYVNDVQASLAFYEKAFGLRRRFFTDEGGKAYGELDTGATRLAFACPSIAKDLLKQDVVLASPATAPLGFELALVTDDVAALYARACASGAAPVSAPETKPWGQTVAYVRDDSGYLVSLCTPLP